MTAVPTARFFSCATLLLICIFHFPARATEETIRRPAINGTGYEAALSPYVETTLSSRIGGYIKAINIREGQSFKAGDALIEFDCDLYEADLRRVRAELRGATETLNSNTRLSELKSISKLNVIMSQVEVDKLKAEESKQTKIVDHCVIRAPFEGSAVQLIASPFQTVSEGEPLLKIIDNTDLQAEFFVPSDRVSQFQEDALLNLTINETGRTYTARVTSVVPRIDPVSQTFKVIALIEGDRTDLLPGMSGRVVSATQDHGQQGPTP